MGENGKLYIECGLCGEKMYGIFRNTHRSACESCGGNKAIYNKDNPHPDSIYSAEKEDDTMG